MPDTSEATPQAPSGSVSSRFPELEFKPEFLGGALICAATQLVLNVMKACLGDEAPDRGDRLVGSASIFDDLGTQIAALVPDGGWRGAAAQTYGEQDLVQSRHVELMADLDQHVAELVFLQADWLLRERQVLDFFIYSVAVLSLYCAFLDCFGGPESKAHSIKIASHASWIAITWSSLSLSYTELLTSRHASDVRAVTHRLADTLGLAGSVAHDPRTA
ncbi:EspA/EspE family type VII secretion system effector [Mycobacterium marinum]|uniref:EspA/EspE family type VII secretion system effector n=1 Tax=Mycobacterium marinum TaxID=1781 RepID=UPI002358DB50|nr:EspA/EspE family type VII secretion system effector [Mycobacterium marinum]MDC8985579.1 EspA/EspE family type VII secretion system effector [Mycobacterium marinum]MDC9002872.1 EspA/EspE family type VII secretion system effector [Mycobacterium marinum]MDC9013609.1 EspA/EspE family type VII secretion system effector [Mycobacterium marinum]MDC9018966.1 EspA/EspE family type VII secretion system effector [Mycobacterium marinum]